MKELENRKDAEPARDAMFKTYQTIVDDAADGESFQDGSCSYKYKWHNQHCIMLFENKLPDMSWRIRMVLEEAEGVRIGKRFRVDEMGLMAVINPNSKELALIKRVVMHAPVSFGWNIQEGKETATTNVRRRDIDLETRNLEENC